MHDRISSHTPDGAVLPRPKKPKRITQANIAMSITPLMPNLRRHTGMSRMHRASLHCDSEIRNVGLSAKKSWAYCSTWAKWLMNVVP